MPVGLAGSLVLEISAGSLDRDRETLVVVARSHQGANLLNPRTAGGRYPFAAWTTSAGLILETSAGSLDRDRETLFGVVRSHQATSPSSLRTGGARYLSVASMDGR